MKTRDQKKAEIRALLMEIRDGVAIDKGCASDDELQSIHHKLATICDFLER